MADINFSAGLETKEAIRNVKAFQKASQKAAEDISSSFKAIKTVALGAVAVFAGGKVLGAIRSVTDAAGVQEDAIKQLNTALALSGSFSQEASQDMQDYASALQSTTGIGDETTLQMLALAKSFNITNEEAQELVTASADLSAQTGISLEGAVRNLGKSLGGLAGELGESVAGIRELTVEQLKAGGAIDLVASRFGGSANAAAQTFSGSVKGLAGAFGDFQEELGFVITKNPEVVKIVKGLQKVFENLGKLVSDNSGDIKKAIADGILSIVKIAPKIIRSLGTISKSAFQVAKVFTSTAGIIVSALSGILSGADGLADGFKLILNPVNATVVAMAALQRTVADFRLTSAAEDVGDLTAEIQDMKSAIREAGASGSPLPFTIDEIRERESALDDAKKSVVDLTTEIKTLDEVGKLAAIEIEVDTESLQKDLQASAEVFMNTELNFDAADAKLTALADTLAKGAEDFGVSLGQATKDIVTQNVPGSGGFVGAPDPGGIEGTDQFVGPINISDEQRKADKKSADDQAKADKESTASLIASAGVAASALTRGADGAADLIGAGVGAAANAFVPGLGAAVGPLVSSLASGGADAATGMVEGLVDALPDLLNNLIEAIPAFVLAIADNIDIIIIAIIKAIPNLIRAIIKAIPGIVAALGKALIRAVAEIGPAILQSIKDGLTAITEFNFAGAIGEAFSIAVSAIREGFGSIGANIGASISGGARKFGQEIAQMHRFLTDPIRKFFNEIIGFDFGAVLVDAFDQAIAFIKADFERNLAIFENAFSGITQFFEDLKSTFTDFDDSVTLITDSFENIGKKFQELADKLNPKKSKIDILGTSDDQGGTGSTPFATKPTKANPLGFGATGGEVAGTGFEDNQLFGLMPGELIIDRGRSQQIVDALESMDSSGGSGGNTDVLLSAILASLTSPQNVTADVDLDINGIAKVMLQLSRSNARLTA